LKDNRLLVMEAVNRDGASLQFASEALQKDEMLKLMSQV